ncbi:uncharacterized protein LOC126829911 [Patella vulgata]|uniref:uncharacterized protein LOC126829911 n=1 Tax=Patella vulgata TaxID=6465 RepID=UPI00217F37AA|nr:uncharacterized protein LOC126829911 [Patella vulgata]XP_050416035.1 uncharacterized protein LOC126829911 [Patella vulgata]
MEKKNLPKEEIKCKICSQSFSSLSDVKSHLENHLNNNYCEICRKTFKNKQTLHKHIVDHLNNDKDTTTRYECSYEGCRKYFKSERNLNHHQKRHNVNKSFKCSKCTKSFTSNSLLQKHLKSHMNIDVVKKFPCSICDHVSLTANHLRQHMRIHSGVRPYKCDVCDKSFNQKPNLTRHVRIHTGEKPYICEICGRAFIESGKLTKHHRVHLGLKNYQCTECGKQFAENRNLTQHLLIHSGEKPHKCVTCDRSFRFISDLREHKLVHTEIKSFLCSVCGRAFKSNRNLKTHIKTLHKSEKLCSSSIVGHGAPTEGQSTSTVRDDKINLPTPNVGKSDEFAQAQTSTVLGTQTPPVRNISVTDVSNHVTNSSSLEFTTSNSNQPSLSVSDVICLDQSSSSLVPTPCPWTTTSQTQQHPQQYLMNSGQNFDSFSSQDNNPTHLQCTTSSNQIFPTTTMGSGHPMPNSSNQIFPTTTTMPVSSNRIFPTTTTGSGHAMPDSSNQIFPTTATGSGHAMLVSSNQIFPTTTTGSCHPMLVSSNQIFPTTTTGSCHPMLVSSNQIFPTTTTGSCHPMPVLSNQIFPTTTTMPVSSNQIFPTTTTGSGYPISVSVYDDYNHSSNKQPILLHSSYGQFQVNDHVILDISNSNPGQHHHLPHLQGISISNPGHHHHQRPHPQAQVLSTNIHTDDPGNPDYVQTSHHITHPPEVPVLDEEYLTRLQSAKALLNVGESCLRSQLVPNVYCHGYQVNQTFPGGNPPELTVTSGITASSLTSFTNNPDIGASSATRNSSCKLYENEDAQLLVSSQATDPVDGLEKNHHENEHHNFESVHIQNTLVKGDNLCHAITSSNQLLNHVKSLQESQSSDLFPAGTPHYDVASETAKPLPMEDLDTSLKNNILAIAPLPGYDKLQGCDSGTASASSYNGSKDNNSVIQVSSPFPLSPMNSRDEGGDSDPGMDSKLITDQKSVDESFTFPVGVDEDDKHCTRKDNTQSSNDDTESVARSPKGARCPSRITRSQTSSNKKLKNKLCSDINKNKTKGGKIRSRKIKTTESTNVNNLTVDMLDVFLEKVEMTNKSSQQIEEQPDVRVEELKCPVCCKLFQHNGSLSQHLRSHTDDFNNSLIQCTICFKNFSKKSNLTQHMKIHEGIKPFNCDSCGKSFLLKRSLFSHQKVHSEDKPFSCKTCGRGFKFQRDLVNHSRIHSGDKPYLCSHCGKSFSLNSSLNRHFRTHNGALPYRCNICGRCFSQNGNMHQHMRTHRISE